MKSIPTAREIGRIWFESIWNERNHEKVHELMTPESVGYLEGGQEIVGPDAFIAFQSSFLEAMPDIHIEIVDMVADEENVCVHWTARGTHTGPGLGMAPTGLAVTFRGVTWLHTRNGQVTGGRDFWNRDGLMRTLSMPVVLK